MYVDDKIPLTYKYVAELGDNYIILSNQSSLNSGTGYKCFVQYFNPSTQVLELNNYHITKGSNYNYDVNYYNNGYYNYIDNIDENFTIQLSEVDIQHYENVFTRQDYSHIIVVVMLILGLYILIWNLASSLVHRGGIFGE